MSLARSALERRGALRSGVVVVAGILMVQSGCGNSSSASSHAASPAHGTTKRSDLALGTAVPIRPVPPIPGSEEEGTVQGPNVLFAVLSVAPYHPQPGCSSVDSGNWQVRVRVSNPSSASIRSSFDPNQFGVTSTTGSLTMVEVPTTDQSQCAWVGPFSLGPHASVEETLVFKVPSGRIDKVSIVSYGANGEPEDRATWIVPKGGG